MRLNRFFGEFYSGGGFQPKADQPLAGAKSFGVNFSEQVIKSSDKDLINQIKNVLRLKKGDEIVLCDGKLNEALCAVKELNAKEAFFKILKTSKNEKEFKQYVVLYCSLLKRENFELVVQKATELGVKEIIPMVAARTVKLGVKIDRLQKIIKEAAEQSGRGIMPVLGEQMDFDRVVGMAGTNDLNLFFELGGESLKKINFDFSKYKKIGIFIGPEGGWSEEELEKVSAKGGSAFGGKSEKFKMVSLSPFTLRAETAAIAALSAVTQQFQ